MVGSLTTGQVSKRLSVTPDTILKWIKNGKLPAMRTVGGHYRISPDAIETLTGRAGNALADRGSSLESPPAVEKRLVHCWEFFALSGKTRKSCQKCLVFRAQALKCFEMNHLPKESGFGGETRALSCEKCTYFRYHQGRPFNVLLITDDKTSRAAIMEKAESHRMHIQFASCEYESSFLVETLRPDFIVVDCTMQEEKCRELCHHLATDPRIHHHTIILATPHQKPSFPIPGSLRMKHPFSFDDLEEYLRENQACHAI